MSKNKNTNNSQGIRREGLTSPLSGVSKADVDALKNRATNAASFSTSFSKRRNEEISEDNKKIEPTENEIPKENGLPQQNGLNSKENSPKNAGLPKKGGLSKKGGLPNKGGLLNKNKKDKKGDSLKDKLTGKGGIKGKIAKIKTTLIMIGIAAGLFCALFFIILFISIGDMVMNSISSFFGIPGTDTKENLSVDESDGLLQSEQYFYDENGNPYRTTDELITALKNDSNCQKQTWLTDLGDWFDRLIDGRYSDLCAYLRYIQSYTTDQEKKYGIVLDKSLPLSTIFNGYATQPSYSQYTNPESAGEMIQAHDHYATLIDVLENGKIKVADLEKIIDNTISNTTHTYYSWVVDVEKDEDGNATKGVGKCVTKSVKDTRYSLKKWQIFMRFGEQAASAWDTEQMTQKAFAGSDEECIGKITEEELLERVATASGTDNNTLDSSVTNAINILSKIEPTDIDIFEQKADVTGSRKDTFENYSSENVSIVFDYKNGFAYNKFPGYKAAFDDPKIDVHYDDAITPKEIETTIQLIIDKKTYMNAILNFEDQDDPDRYKRNYDGYSSVILGAFCGDQLTAPFDQIMVEVVDCDGEYLETVPLKEYVMGVAYREVSDKEDDYVKAQMLAAKNFALYRRNNYAKGTVIKMRSGNCDQAYCPMTKGCHSKKSSLDCGGFKCTSYIPGKGSGTNTGAAGQDRITKYASYYDELKDMLLIDKSTGKVAATYYTNVKQNKWYEQAKNGMNFTQIIQESYANDGKNYELVNCTTYDNESSEENSTTTTPDPETHGNGPTLDYKNVAPSIGQYYGFSYSDDEGGKTITINPEWIEHNITRVESECEEAGWNESYQVNVLAADNYKKAFKNVCKILTEGVKLSNGEHCLLSKEDLQGGETFSPRKNINGSISTLSYGIVQNWNYNKEYMINDRIFKPFNPVEDAEEYQAFIRELGKEEDCRNVNYILYKYAYKPAGFNWGGNSDAYNGMHFYLE